MSIAVLIPRDQLERRYKGELDETEKQLRQAKPHEVDEARRRFKQTLHNFALVVVEGRRPKD